MPIRWSPYILKNASPVEAHELERLESVWGVKLPEDYKRTVSLYQGMTPEPAGFRVGRGGNALSVLLSVHEHEGRESYSLMNSYEALRSHVPPGLFPFGRTPGGEDLCFDYRNSQSQPRIVLVSADTSIHSVAESFQALMKSLLDD